MELRQAVEDHLRSEGEIRWQEMPGDASNRSYARLHFSNAKTKILMLLNAPEAFKSEEVTGADEGEYSQDLDFVRVAKAWASKGIRVPKIDYVDPQNRFLICEDFGDELLYTERQKNAALDWYENALDELVKIQSLPPQFPFKKGAFTPELLKWELHHFQEYAIEERQKSFSEKARKSLSDFFGRLLEDLISMPVGVVHRDFHSKNLMLLREEGRIGIIDFQDALLGPRVYDVASLLRDSYVRLTDEEESRLLEYFNKNSEMKISFNDLSKMSLQRNMKAVGRFFYISIVKGRPSHLPYVKPSLQRIFRTLEDLKEFEVRKHLEEILEGDF